MLLDRIEAELEQKSMTTAPITKTAVREILLSASSFNMTLRQLRTSYNIPVVVGRVQQVLLQSEYLSNNNSNGTCNYTNSQ